MNIILTRMLRTAGHAFGHQWMCFAVLTFFVGWCIFGAVHGYDERWFLYIDRAITIATGVGIFLLQVAQNEDTLAIHLKLDALMKASAEVSDELIEVEHQEAHVREELRETTIHSEK